MLIGPPVPRHEFIPAGSKPFVRDLGDDVGDICLWFEAIEFGALDD